MLPLSDLEQMGGPPSRSHTPLLPASAPQSGCATPAAISEAGARFADATLASPGDQYVRADEDSGASSSQVPHNLEFVLICFQCLDAPLRACLLSPSANFDRTSRDCVIECPL